jgi:hypothetical protein
MRHFIYSFLLAAPAVFAAPIVTNSVQISNPPEWLKKAQLSEVVSRIERKLEWSTKRVNATWYGNQDELVRAFGKNAPHILAFTRKSDGSVHVGPKVTKENFNEVFGHEMGHVILSQKFKKAIPLWLEEGLVNHVAGVNQINYKWLLLQPRLALRGLQHPFNAASQDTVNFHYMASSAVIKMLEKKCGSFRELLNLSLRSNMDDYIASFCKIPDLDAAFWKWTEEKAKL